MKEGEENSDEDEPKQWEPPLTSVVGKFEQFATPSGFSCKDKLVDNCATLIRSVIEATEDELEEEDVSFILSLSGGKHGPKHVYSLISLALSKGLQPRDVMTKGLTDLCQQSSAHIPAEAIDHLKTFLTANDGEFALKEETLDMLSVQYEARISNKNPAILETIEPTIAYGNPHMIAIYVKAASCHAKYVPLSSDTAEKVWKIVLEPRFDLEVRKQGAQCVFWIQKGKIAEPTGDREAKKLMKNVLALLKDEHLWVYSCFVILILLESQISSELAVPDELVVRLKGLCKDEGTEGSSNQLKGLLERAIQTYLGTQRVQEDHADWRCLWVELHPDDASCVVSADKKLSRILSRREEESNSQAKQALKVEVHITKARHYIAKRQFEKAESMLHFARNQLVDNDEGFKKIQLLMANVFCYQGKWKGASRLLSHEDMKLNGKGLLILSYLARCKFDKAEEIVKEKDSDRGDEMNELLNAVKQFYDLLSRFSNQGINAAIARNQVKTLVTKTFADKMKTADVTKLVTWIVHREEHFDLGVLSHFAVCEWKLELLRREVFARCSLPLDKTTTKEEQPKGDVGEEVDGEQPKANVPDAVDEEDLAEKGDNLVSETEDDHLFEPDMPEEANEREEQEDSKELQELKEQLEDNSASPDENVVNVDIETPAVEVEESDEQKEIDDVPKQKILKQWSGKRRGKKTAVKKRNTTVSIPWTTFLKATNNLQDYIQDTTEQDGEDVMIQILEQVRAIQTSQPSEGDDEPTSSPIPLQSIVELLELCRLPSERIVSLLKQSSVSDETEDTDSSQLEQTLSRIQVAWLQSKFGITDQQMEDDSKSWAPLKQLWNTWTAIDMKHRLGFHYFENFLSLCINSSNNVDDVLGFFQFCLDRNVATAHLQHILLQSVGRSDNTLNLGEWQKEYVKQTLLERAQLVWKDLPEEGTTVFPQLLQAMSSSLVQEEDVGQILNHLESMEDVLVKKTTTTALSQVLTVGVNYGLDKSEWSDIIKHLVSGNSENWISDIRSKLKDKILQTSSIHAQSMVKTVDTLVQEFRSINEGSCNAAILQTIGGLPSFLQDIKTEMGNFSGWGQPEILHWSQSARTGHTRPSLVELFAVIQTVMKDVMGYSLRDVGVMAMKLLTCQSGVGCLGKIATGEGKSGLVAALAVIKLLALESKTIDVVTSSPILAERDVEEWEVFYRRFGLSVMHNSEPQPQPGQPKPCYSADVVYGDASNFEGDILRHEFSLLGTRGDRSCDTAIVDEVDSMFIDGSNHSTRLIDQMPQMDSLEPVFALIWNYVAKHAAAFTSIEGETFAIGARMGGVGELITIIYRALPSEYFTKLNCSDPNTLSKVLSEFASNMLAAEREDKTYRNKVNQLLKSKGMVDTLPATVVKQLEKSTEKGVDEYIKYKWDMSVPNSQLKALEVLLDVKISVYENVNEEMKLSTYFHSIEDFEDSTSSYPASVQLFSDKVQMCLLHPVRDQSSHIAHGVEKSVRKSVGHSGAMLKLNDNDVRINIPFHLFELFNTKVDEWIQSAIQAKLFLQQDRDYVIRSEGEGDNRADTITPVDYMNTGVTQESCVWGEGLHQFLQLKHKLRITPEYLATNFISNLSFFNRYGGGKRLYGVTGTLGDANEIGLLRHMYTVDILNVPTFKTKRLLELQSIVAMGGTEEWLNDILHSVNWELGQRKEEGRAVLIICKTIEDVGRVHKHLSANLKLPPPYRSAFRLYSRSDDESTANAVKSPLQPGEIVIATNLAGRGTNIKLSPGVLANGGLHVITSFLPSNLRVEEQAAGRAARAGEPGTTQLIIDAAKDLSHMAGSLTSLEIDDVKRCREGFEKVRIDHIRDKLVKELNMEERQFQKYCQLKAYIQSVRQTSADCEDHMLNGIGERWAVELEEVKTRHDILNWPYLDTKFDYFFGGLKREFLNQSAIRNPSHHTLQGNDFNLKDKYADALEDYGRAIRLDPVYSQHAYYNRAYALINEQGDGYKEKAAEDLKIAAELINNYHIPYLLALYQLVEEKPLKTVKDKYEEGEIPAFVTSSENSPFTNQIINKLNFNYLQVKSVQEAFQMINETKGDLLAEYGDIEEFYKKADQVVNYEDVEDMSANGFVRFIYLKKKPVPWWDILAVFLLGALQIIGGICACLLGAGNVGAGLIAEGVSDFITGSIAAATGEFSWKDYLKNKAMSIGVSLALAGAGVAATFLKSVPQVATALTALSNTAFVKKLVTVGGSIKSFIKTGLESLQKGISSGWKSFSGLVSKGWTSFTNSGGMKWLGTQWKAAWASAPKLVHQMKDKLVDWAKKAWGYAKDAYNYVLGTQALEPAKATNLRLAGQLVVREALKQGILFGLDKSVLKAIGDAIERRLLDTVRTFLSGQFQNSGTQVHQRCTKVFNSCKGKQLETRLRLVGNNSLHSQESSFGKQFYQQMVQGSISMVAKFVMEKTMEKKQTGVFGLAKHLLDQVVDAVSRGQALTEAIVELNTILPTLIEDIMEALTKMEEHLESHDHSSPDDCDGKNNPVDSRDQPRVFQEYVNNWSETIAGRMKDLIMGHVISPSVSLTVTSVFDKLTNAEEFQDLLEKKVEGNREVLASNFAKYGPTFLTKVAETGPAKSGDGTKSSQEGKGGDSDDIVKFQPDPNQWTYEDTSGESTDAILSLLSFQLSASIELYNADGESGMKLRECYGGNFNPLVDAQEPIRIVEERKDGVVSYATLIKDGDSLMMMKFGADDEKAVPRNHLLDCVAARFNSSGMNAKELQRFRTAVISEIEETQPLTLKSYSGGILTGNTMPVYNSYEGLLFGRRRLF